MEETENNSEARYPENVELNKSTKSYTWKIRLFLKDKDLDVLKRLKEIDDKLKEDYLEED